MNHPQTIDEIARAMIHHLNSKTLSEMIDQAETFNRAPIRNLSDAQVASMLERFHGKTWYLPWNRGTLTKGHSLYRARVVDRSWGNTERDCWCPPKENVSIGRLNREQEPRLYLASSENLAVDEIKAQPEDEIAIIEYELTNDLVLTWFPDSRRCPTKIGSVNLNTAIQGKLKFLLHFGSNWITLDVAPGTEYLYRVSNQLADTYYPRVGWGWLYRPVNPNSDDDYNVCLADRSNESGEDRSINDLLDVKRIYKTLYKGREISDDGRAHNLRTCQIDGRLQGRKIIWNNDAKSLQHTTPSC